MKCRMVGAAVALAIFASANPLPPAQEAPLRQQFLDRQKKTKSWSAAFSQTLVMPGMRQPIVSSGRLAYRAPAQLKLDFSQPEGEFVLVQGDRLFLQKAGKKLAAKSLTEDRAGKPFQSLLGLLSGQPAENEGHYSAEVTRHDANYHIVLTRTAQASRHAPKRIVNVIDATSLDMRTITVELPNGSTLRYEFSEIARNHPLPDSTFAVP